MHLSPEERDSIVRRLAEIAAEQESIPACSSGLTKESAQRWDLLYREMLDLEQRMDGDLCND